MAKKQAKGKCECCGKLRVLTVIDSGQGLCRTCVKELRPPRPNNLASLKQIQKLREAGVSVSDELTKDQLFEITATMGHAYHYVLDLWERERGTRVIYDNLIPGYDQRGEVYRFVGVVREQDALLIERIARVQADRDTTARARYEADAAAVANENVYQGLFKPKLNRDRDYKAIVKHLRSRFKGF